MSPWPIVLLCADGAVLLASIRRNYFGVVLRTTLKKMVCVASSTASTTSPIAGSCLSAAADAHIHMVVAC